MSARTRYQALADLITPEFVRTAFPGPLDRYQEGVYGAQARDAPELLQSFERCIEWARSHGAINDANEAKIRKGKYPWLILGAVSREATAERVDLLCDTITWFIITDDIIDSYHDAVLGSLNDIRIAINSFVQILREPSVAVDPGAAQYHGFFEALCSMARSISERIWACHPALASPVIDSLVEFINSIFMEHFYLRTDSRIVPWIYPELRARTIAIIPLFDITLLVNGVIISMNGVRDVTVEHIYTSSALGLAILNDVVSFRKEALLSGNTLNSFVAFEFDALRDVGIQEEEAARFALDHCVTHYRDCRRALYAQVEWLPPELGTAFADTLNDVVTSVIDWHIHITRRDYTT